MHRALLLLLAAAPAFSLTACASSASESPDAAANDSNVAAAASTCSSTAYNAALASYKKAVASARSRLANGACSSDDAYITDIVRDANAAVTTCASFHAVIDKSPWAKPVRDVLADNLALPSLTGKLTTGSWAGLDDALVGVTMWGPAPGVYGNMSKIAFGSGHTVVVSQLVVDDKAGTTRWAGQNGTYAVGAPKADGSIPVSLHYGNPGAVDVTYDLSEDAQEKDVFHMKPEPGPVPPAEYLSVPSECDV
jgi:hypothetical protein